MTTTSRSAGSIAHLDLTVPDAPLIRDFYQAVVGWTASELDMGGYADFVMLRPDAEEPVAGICHARGPNADLPAQWLVYLVVPDLDASMSECTARGGQVIVEPRKMGAVIRYCVIRDPAGAVAALISYGDNSDR